MQKSMHARRLRSRVERRRRIHWLPALLAFCVALALPASTLARPSLIGLEADLQQVLDGLCHGDPALCGKAAPLSVVGQIDFDSGAIVADFAELVFAFGTPGAGGFAFENLQITVDTSGLSAPLSGDLASGTTFPTVDIIVPNPSGPGDVTILALQTVGIRSMELVAGGSFTAMELDFTKVQYSWLGQSSDWDIQFNTGGGCTVAPGEKHVALNGNDPSLLNAGEVEADFGLGVSRPPLAAATLTFSHTRESVASSPCHLRHAATGATFEAVFSRLSPLSDTFATQLIEEGIDVKLSLIDSYTLSISARGFEERIELESISADLTTKTFNPITGAETSSSTQSLP